MTLATSFLSCFILIILMQRCSRVRLKHIFGKCEAILAHSHRLFDAVRELTLKGLLPILKINNYNNDRHILQINESHKIEVTSGKAILK